MKGVVHIELCADSTRIRAAKNWKEFNKSTCTMRSSYMTSSNFLTHTVHKKFKIKKKTSVECVYVCVCVCVLLAIQQGLRLKYIKD